MDFLNVLSNKEPYMWQDMTLFLSLFLSPDVQKTVRIHILRDGSNNHSIMASTLPSLAGSQVNFTEVSGPTENLLITQRSLKDLINAALLTGNNVSINAFYNSNGTLFPTKNVGEEGKEHHHLTNDALYMKQPYK